MGKARNRRRLPQQQPLQDIGQVDKEELCKEPLESVNKEAGESVCVDVASETALTAEGAVVLETVALKPPPSPSPPNEKEEALEQATKQPPKQPSPDLTSFTPAIANPVAAEPSNVLRPPKPTSHPPRLPTPRMTPTATPLPTAPRLECTVVPGRSVGPFILGAPIGEVVERLRGMEGVVPRVECKYGDLNPLDIDIVLNLPANGVCMRFDPKSQCLKSIELYDFSKLSLFYNGVEFNSYKVLPTFVHIYRLFGPIYPGEFCEEKKHYVLSYPGISFMFPIPDKYIPLQNITDLPLSFPDGTTPVLNRIYVYAGAEKWEDAVPPTLSQLEPITAELNHGIHIPQRDCTLKFGAPAQDVLDALGKPEKILEKGEDKMKIFGVDVAEECDGGGYFWNYFSLGIDILFSGTTHTITKFILHTNFLGCWEFGEYTKCRFQVVGFENGAVIGCDDLWNDVQSTLPTPSPRPVVFNRGNHHNPFGSTWFYGFDGVVFEVMKNGYLASVTLYA
ncbi:uncharacterized protein SPPG_06021 [Spizellomyces punctatus DAOM BR117]|uniref:Uncharacterized protein n=1 Tax=Spizellomyces punctatus (strain DAOM BR117) TaxID=645134 RepID=A0A0L0HDP2_SPIPD|nr:uncharacterized protein SPPG_06021 [Spizellomyces punctatus DAOM BR117]KNC99074.1 hypothetical protein SPPG_06021 [Spizellomyces punctatus DAOM BR117]|eukprot:XP_016607114.1 hypothetical protein SPPG_06021 [Spizellomyces punctatus DAOM BR117]